MASSKVATKFNMLTVRGNRGLYAYFWGPWREKGIQEHLSNWVKEEQRSVLAERGVGSSASASEVGEWMTDPPRIYLRYMAAMTGVWEDIGEDGVTLYQLQNSTGEEGLWHCGLESSRTWRSSSLTILFSFGMEIPVGEKHLDLGVSIVGTISGEPSSY